MSKKIYIVKLKDDERDTLLDLVKSAQTKARKLNRAHILLLADQGESDPKIARALHTSESTVQRTRKRFVEGNLDFALNERRRPGAQPKLSSKDEALLIALSKSTPPAGRKCWSMQLLADRLVELGEVESISDETVRRILKRHQALAETTLVHSQCGRRVRMADGRRAGLVCRTLRSQGSDCEL